MHKSQRKLCSWIIVLFLPLAMSCSLPFEMNSSGESDDSQTVATLGKKSISLGELHEWMKDQYLKDLLENSSPSERYEAESGSLNHLIDERLLAQEAKKQGVSTEDLIKKTIAKQPEVTDAEVRAFYEKNASRIGSRPYESVSEMIRNYLIDRRESLAQGTLIQGLRQNAEVTVLLEQPRNQVAASGASVGPDDAPVTIVEFSDYQCPYCKRADPTMWQLIDKYPTQVRWVYRHFPLPMHANAHHAAEAAVCARNQGKFWQLHRLLFRNSRNLAPDALSTYAGQAGLDLKAFNECMEKGGGKAEVEADIAAGQRLGVSGTPNFFVNGISMTGAQPIGKFEEIIQRELERQSTEKPKQETSPDTDKKPAPAKPAKEDPSS